MESFGFINAMAAISSKPIKKKKKAASGKVPFNLHVYFIWYDRYVMCHIVYIPSSKVLNVKEKEQLRWFGFKLET